MAWQLRTSMSYVRDSRRAVSCHLASPDSKKKPLCDLLTKDYIGDDLAFQEQRHGDLKHLIWHISIHSIFSSRGRHQRQATYDYHYRSDMRDAAVSKIFRQITRQGVTKHCRLYQAKRLSRTLNCAKIPFSSFAVPYASLLLSFCQKSIPEKIEGTFCLIL